MQFYIINKDPWKNAEILPDYCLLDIYEGEKKREGENKI
jgi:hypothetical protein